MARAPDARAQQAKELFLSGMKLIDIAEKLGVSEGTVRSWKSRYGWDENATLQKRNRNVAKEKGVKKKSVEKHIVEEVESVLGNAELTDKQRLFCLYFVKSFNATKAYQKAFKCDYGTANASGSRMLVNVSIQKEIRRLKKERMAHEFLSEADIFQKYMDIAFADITDYVEFGREQIQVMGAFGPVMVSDEETGKKVPLMKDVNTVRFKESSEVDGTIISEVKQGKDGASIKLADRMKALEWLANHMDIATDEQKARLALLKAQTDKLTGNNQEIEDMDEIESDIYGERE